MQLSCQTSQSQSHTHSFSSPFVIAFTSSRKLLHNIQLAPMSAPQISDTVSIRAVKQNQNTRALPANTPTKQGDWQRAEKFPNYWTQHVIKTL